MHYQAKGNTILSQLQGSSVSLHDVVFYTVALCIPLVFITYPSDVRLLLLAGVLVCWGLERAVMQHVVMLLGYSQAMPSAGSSAAAGSRMAAQDIKVGVRLLVLGGTLGVVLWLLLKRRAASNRREAIFQAIQQSVSDDIGGQSCRRVHSCCLLQGGAAQTAKAAPALLHKAHLPAAH